MYTSPFSVSGTTNNCLAAAIAGEIWAIRAEAFQRMLDRLGAPKAEGEVAARSAPLPKVEGTVVLLPLYGMLQERSSFFLDFFGGTSTQQFGRMFTAALNSPSVKGVVIDIDSPGGTAAGTPELAKRIFEARGKKPIVAVANSEAASAAYWIGTAADKLVVTPSGDVGSIGVWSMHQDWSKAEEMDGVKTTLVSAGKYKVEGHPFAPLDDDAHDEMQRRVDAIHRDFIADVAKHRGVTEHVARTQFGEGRMLRAKEAHEAGMVDRVSTLEKVLADMGVTRAKAGSRAEDEAILEMVLSAGALSAELDADVEPVTSGGDPDVLRRKLRLKEIEVS